ncbi:YqaA family protein [Gilvimarinus algae]|uniref:VTT domain-containing protein n=1 Tax=Gilvimarinus algae TaxID=3058037 RepID=A0ABT8TG52_9GAMM|nr:VTT domain-containing protein [Gilvimarinus sp. SDUM040014]MDO3383059.1 VTT domain-containing protein [Gilvimarinus sp. SDUM040014]
MSQSFASARAKKWFDRVSQSPHMLWLIGVLSFLETIIIPIPIELVLIPLMAANKHRIWRIATATTAGCLLASLIGYGVGAALFQSVGQWAVDTMGWQSAFDDFQRFFDTHGFGAVLLVGILPIPFQVAMITAGMTGYPIALFVLAALLARGIRYYGLAFLVKRYGNAVVDMWQKRALTTSLIAAAVVACLYLLLQFLAGKVL